ncbi:S1/P1 nuclease [Lysobacter sp. GX 14042]|uniref:S1/P1 nuclease n=1 Tax=Lysobacter sp. GX 14042 TaxID=2907155 RepID=UPI001F4283A6|nr:S1/P1 nuclease [Lysobacter sp. GX 14042]MCE7033547.1 S1/P1 nuclease [Lysobacter sp. GX 14042]
MARSRFHPTALRPALAALVVLAPSLAFAWGPQGHRLVADVAWNELAPETRTQVQRLLQGEPDPTLAGIANWADQLRELDPDLGRRSAGWHYVNIGEDECHYHPSTACPDGNCVVEAISAQAGILADRARSDAERLQALKFVVHFVGDVHQPLHAGYAHDKGGNTVQVNLDGKGSNLHRLWDSGLLNTAGLDDEAYLARLDMLPLVIAERPALPPAAPQWAEQSCSIALSDGFYPARARIDGDYVERWRPVAEEQLRRAGIELARLLDAALDPDAP